MLIIILFRHYLHTYMQVITVPFASTYMELHVVKIDTNTFVFVREGYL